MPKIKTTPKAKKTNLFLIHPQNSFCKLVPAEDQQQFHDGELCVMGAWDDMERVARPDSAAGRQTGRHLHHGVPTPAACLPSALVSGYGEPSSRTVHPHAGGERNHRRRPTRRQRQAVLPTRYTTTIPYYLERTLGYLKALAEGKRYEHRIWPPHCLIGTPGVHRRPGHAVAPGLVRKKPEDRLLLYGRQRLRRAFQRRPCRGPRSS